jgi:Spy/CpxP family protein refolding chaperone
MSDSKKYKLVLSGFIIMVILNIAVLVSIWIMRPPFFHPHPPPPPKAPPPVEHLFKQQLNLNKKQRKIFIRLRNRQISRSKKIIRDIQKKRGQLINLLKTNQADSSKVDSLILLMGKDQMQLESNVFNHFKQIRALCNPQQKKVFDHIIQRVFLQYESQPKQ